jgi:hypothetical protein
MAYASEADLPSLWANAILDFQMATLHSDFDSVAKER